MKRYVKAAAIDPLDAADIRDKAYGYDAVAIAFKWMSDKFDGYESYQDSFDVSYQGSAEELTSELFDVLATAGLPVYLENDTTIIYENGNVDEHIKVYPLPEDADFSLTPDSFGYSVDVEEIYK